MAASFDLHTLAVLGATGERVVIWHVNVGAALGESRLSGAWVLDRSRDVEIDSLTRGYPIALADEGVRIADAADEGAPLVDAADVGAPVVDDADENAPVVGAAEEAAVRAEATDGRARIAAAAGIVDVDATVENVRAAIESADEQFSQRQDASGGKHIRPQWPVIVAPDEAALPNYQVNAVDDGIRPVLTLARGFAELADAWAAFESLRLARPFLEDLGGPAARPLPLAVR
ncbi:hypothetical protein [Nocardia aurantiaca]|uniref:Uncharacterized protein n=1 Tax=Nocardia aurantiaca TaxID=2675850 RepID=A0A6I3KX89_9NOCA|nr:hypothetical protein [Nocardia aurantiaca]MTE14101.1 hypothetical protein [Nocardia aurantiaca]